MADPIRIANCSGFYGDRLSAASEMVNDGPIDVLTGDWLAELTMLILARTQAKRPNGGYARSFVTQMEQVMATCMEKNIKVVSNAGGLDPASCAEAVAEEAAKVGLNPSFAYIEGDNILSRIPELTESGIDFKHMDTGDAITELDGYISANAYLGCWGIVESLNNGADIVITGRVTDAAVVCGPAAWHHQWAKDDWDSLAGAVVAGHVIECGTQATGGNYSFFTEVKGMSRTGFPWADIADDGSSVIGKHEGTGGEVSMGTVTSQLLYEIGSPSYLGPDVTARFDTLELKEISPDRVLIENVKGEPPPETLKVSMNKLGGYRTDMSIALTGLDIKEKAELVEEAFWKACPHEPEDFESVKTKVVRTDKEDPQTNEEAVALWRITVKDTDEKKVGRAIFNSVNELGLATIPGLFGIGGGGNAKPFGVHWPALIPSDLVPQHVIVLDGKRTIVESHIVGDPVSIDLPDDEAPLSDFGKTVRAPLGVLVGARSGDKTGNANLGVFARNKDAWLWLDSFLTTKKFQELLPETAQLQIDRYRLPKIFSLNFLVHGLLEEGVASSTRQDSQAKSFGEWLRARVVDIPERLID